VPAKVRRRWEAEAAEADTGEIPAVAAVEPDGADQPQVGYTGARFASAAVRRRWQVDPPDLPRQGSPVLPPEHAPEPPPEPPPTRASQVGRPPAAPAGAGAEDPATLVRPYVHTGGRTRPGSELALETLVTASAPATCESWPANPEYRAVIGLCAAPRSIAEVAALAKLPVGVARVLVGDLAELRLVTVHPTGATADLALMERVLTGLRRL
jgi:hypothetical protein